MLVPILVRRSVFILGFFACGLGALSGCVTATEQFEQRLKVGESVSHVYDANYDAVETALKQAMIKYPQRVDNTDAGIFETDFVRGDACFKPPMMTGDFSNGYRYRLLIRMAHGKIDGRSAVKVTIIKQAEISVDFFAAPTPVASDGLEEMVILYRIERELAIAKAMLKSANKAPAHS